MALTDTDSLVQGIGTNPGLLYRAPDFSSGDGELVYGSSYLDGKAVRGRYTGQVLMETPWISKGTLNNIVMPTVYMEGSGATSNVDYLKIYVYKRDPENLDTVYEPTEIIIKYRDNISNTVGAMPVLQSYNRPASQFYWFDIRYEYKFVVQIGRVTTGGYLDLEGMYLVYYGPTVTVGPKQELFGDSVVQAVPIWDALDWSATSDGSGVIDTTLSIQNYTTAGMDTGAQHAYFNNVEGVVTGFGYGSTIDSSTQIQSDYQASSSGGYEIKVYASGLAINTIQYFYTLIMGHQNAVEV